MTETTVAYHAEYLQPGRPAINVKVRGRIFDNRRYAALHGRLSDNPAIGPAEADRMAEAAWESVCEAFWQAAEDQAHGFGLGAIVQEGRSGGWLVFEDGYDPDEDYPDGDDVTAHVAMAERQQRWLAAYRSMAEWCAAAIAAAPDDLADALEAMAVEGAVTP